MPLDRKFILCIEPNQDMCLILRLMLHRSDLSFKFSRNIEDSKTFLQNEAPALILIENTFALLDLRRCILLLKKRAPVSKLLMLSSTEEDSSKIALSAGIDRFLIRPFNKATLVNVVLSMLS